VIGPAASPLADSTTASSQAGLSPELFAKIRGIQIRAQRLVTDLFAGEYESAFKGRGMEFEAVREYQPGDDLRHVDWNVTARMDHPYVKQHREERELTVMLLVDTSASTDFGTADKVKGEVAAEVAALLAYTAIKSHDRVGLIAFSDQVELYIPPKKGRGHVWRVIRAILTLEPSHRGTDLAGRRSTISAGSAAAARWRSCISDFWAAGFATDCASPRAATTSPRSRCSIAARRSCRRSGSSSSRTPRPASCVARHLRPQGRRELPRAGPARARRSARAASLLPRRRDRAVDRRALRRLDRALLPARERRKGRGR
jgi:uncharacterized protein (DUF58 family)